MRSNNELALELVKELVKRGSARPIESENAVAQFIFEYLSDLKLKPQKLYYENDRFSVIVIGQDDPQLIINGHMDTVPVGDRSSWDFDPYGEVKDGRFYGRGSADTKGQIAAILAAMATCFNERVCYIFNVEEEMSLNGIKSALAYLQKE